MWTYYKKRAEVITFKRELRNLNEIIHIWVGQDLMKKQFLYIFSLMNGFAKLPSPKNIAGKTRAWTNLKQV